jgi:hypothetical protein
MVVSFDVLLLGTTLGAASDNCERLAVAVDDSPLVRRPVDNRTEHLFDLGEVVAACRARMIARIPLSTPLAPRRSQSR